MQVFPTEESDENKNSKTGIVVSQVPSNGQQILPMTGAQVNIAKFARNSLFIFGENNWLRKKIIWLTEWKFFEIGIVITILINTVILAMQDYRYRLSKSQSTQWRNDLILQTEDIFSSIYITEFVLKVIAQGFVLEKGSYLRDNWNILDFIIVISSIINILPIPIVFMGVKVLRVLRPLRSINSIRGLRVLMSSLLESLPALGNVVVFLLFTIVLFAIIGMQLFNGIYARRCRTTPAPVNGVWNIDESVANLCTVFTCPTNLYCGDSLSKGLYFSYSDLQSSTFFYGLATFDNMWYSIFTIFQALTTEGWSSTLYVMIDAFEPLYVYTYFIILVLVGSFFLINLILAVINDSFVNQQEQMNEEEPRSPGSESSFLNSPYEEAKDDYLIEIEGGDNPTQPKANQNNSKDKDNQNTDNKLDGQGMFKQLSKKKTSTSVFSPVDTFKKQSSFHPSKLEVVQSSSTKLGLKNSQTTVVEVSKSKENEISLFPKLEKDRSSMAMAVSNLQQIEQTENDNIPEALRITNYQQLRRIATSNLIRSKESANIFTRLINSTFFIAISTSMILGNTIVLSLDRYPLSTSESSALDLANSVFTVGFVVEMILKIIGTGLRTYVKSTYNLFDSFIVIISIVDLTLSYSGMSQNLGIISALRTFRLFRIFKLARSWVTLSTLLSVISHTVQSIQHFFTLLLIFIIITSLIAMELFAYSVRFLSDGTPTSNYAVGTSPRVNFDTLADSLTTVFILLTNESWNIIMYDHVRALGQPYCIFFIAVVVFGNYVLLKLFIAILIYNFSEATIKYQHKMEAEKKKKMKKMLGKSDFYEDQYDPFEDTELNSSTPLSQSQYTVQKYASTMSKQPTMYKKALKSRDSHLKIASPALSPHVFTLHGPSLSMGGGNTQNALVLEKRSSMKNISGQNLKNSMMQFSYSTNNLAQQQPPIEEIKLPKRLEGTALFLLPAKFWLRRIIFSITFHTYFEYFIIFLILVSSVLLCLDSPFNDPDSQYSIVITYMNEVITICFIVEAGMKILSLGLLFNGSNSYLRSISNCSDFLIVAMSSLDLFMSSSNSSVSLSTFKVIRILRILRPLKIISRSEGLSLAMNSLINSLPSLLNLQIIIFIVFLLFGIFGVNQFKGSFYSCSNVANLSIVDTKKDCLDLGGDWINQAFNFDNIINALVNLFILSTTEGWIDRMNLGIDSRGIDMQPKTNNSQYWSLYFISFVFIGSFFIINLFVGIVVDSFSKEKDKLGGVHLLLESQQEWVQIHERLLLSKPLSLLYVPPRAARFRHVLKKFVQHPWFDKFIMGCILISTVNFMLVWVNQPTSISDQVSLVSQIFLYLFAAEAVLKIIVFGTSYFWDSANIMDLTIVVFSTAGQIITYLNILTSVTDVTSIFLLLRIIRILRLIRQIKSLRIILNTIIISLPALLNIGGLLFLLLFLYAILGMNLFSYVKPGPSGQGVTDKIHFKSFFSSFFTLLKISTGEQWDILMDDITRTQTPDYVCFSESTYQDYAQYGLNGCGSYIGLIYLMTFQILFSMIVLNLFVAVILEGFEKSENDEQSQIKPYQLEQFITKWSKYDPSGTGFICAGNLFTICEDLDHPFGWKNLSVSSSRKNLILAQLALPLYTFKADKGYYVNFYETLERISMTAMVQHYGEFETTSEKKIKVLRDLQKKKTARLKQNKSYGVNGFFIVDFIAASLIENSWFRYKALKGFTKKPSAILSQLSLNRQPTQVINF